MNYFVLSFEFIVVVQYCSTIDTYFSYEFLRTMFDDVDLGGVVMGGDHCPCCCYSQSV